MSFELYLLPDMSVPLQSSHNPLPLPAVLALALADLEQAVASAVVAELVFQRLCWC